MIKILLAILTALGPRTDELARGAERTAPSYLTPETAREHAFAAVVAGEIYGVDPALLLSIAWHESRYSVAAITPEVGGKVSCGALTPEPKPRCSAWDHSLLGGYLAGAEHLARWRRIYNDARDALTAYAGGGSLVAMCHFDNAHRACNFAAQMLDRARAIATAGPRT